MSSVERSPPGEERVSTIAGGRLCASCGFSLVGQTIVREPHYRMLIVRCPECGAVAALQEYPALGRWANRWAALLAALWLVVLVAALFGSAGMTFGLSRGIAETVSQDLAVDIATAHNAWYNALENPGATVVSRWIGQGAGQGAQAAHAYSFIELTWWRQQDQDAFLAERGGWWQVVRGAGLWQLWFLLPAGGVVGVFWSIALLNLRRSRAMLAACTVVALAGVFLFLSFQGTGSGFFGGVAYANHLALEALAVPLGLLPLAVAGAVIAGAVWIGRPLVRLAVRVLLPPSFRGPLAMLWTAEGLPPPKTR